MDSIRKGLAFLLLSVGMGLFALVILMKVDAFAQKAEAETQQLSADLDWEGYLYQQTARKVLRARNSNQ